jgi:transcriptional regulator with XRE-family HTH domain
MNTILGARIRSLRESKGYTQEEVSKRMNCTRQKYARIEKGLIDISYANITTIANILGVKPEDITSAVNHIEEGEPLFRNNGSVISDKFAYISEMINIFYAHKKLYDSIRQVDIDE